MPALNGPYIIVDPVNDSNDDVLVLLEIAASASTEEDLFESLQNILKRRSYCRIPVNFYYFIVEENAQQWFSTMALHKQWTDRCYNPSLMSRERCKEDCAFNNVIDDELDTDW